MTTLSDRLYAQARITPVKPDNAAASVRKLADGSLEVTQGGGNVFTIDPDDLDLQTFLVWTMLNTDATH